jgi:TetR/AcrR family transcriptional repressor of nem operon
VTTRKGEATRARIVEAAADLLVTGNDVNLDDVMRLTHTSKGQLFHYFPDGKEQLRRVAAERHLTRLAEAEAPAAALTSWHGWEAWIEQILHLHNQQTIDHACEIAALAGRALDTDSFTRELVGRMYERWIDQIGRQLVSMQEAGLLRVDTPVPELVSTFIAALQGGSVIDRATGSQKHLTRALNQALVLLRSYEPVTAESRSGAR